MNILYAVDQLRQLISTLEQQMSICSMENVDVSHLAAAKRNLSIQLSIIQQSPAYQVAAFEYYGEVPDLENMQIIVDEVGYDQIASLYGNDWFKVLQEAAEVSERGY